MELEDVNTEVSAPSAEIQNDVAPEAAVEAPADADEASSPSEGVTEADTLSIVRDVVNEGKKEAEAASPAEGAEEGSTTEEPEAKKESDNEDYSDVPFGKHPRFKELIKERNALRVDAERYQNVQKFMDSNGISAEEAADGFLIMGLMKTNPAEAWNRLKPIVQNLAVAAGEVLPEDLSGMVQRGEITHAAALEVSRARASANSMRTEMSFREQQAQVAQQRAHQQSLIDAANSWQSERMARDPNFNAKVQPLMKELAFIQMNEGRPNTVDGVRDQLKRAYDAITPAVAAPVQPPKAKTPPRPTSTTGQSSGNAQPAPQSTLDIIRAARQSR